MSYDLAIWKNGSEASPEEVYLALNDHRKHPAVLPAKEELAAFLKALKKRCRDGYDVERAAGGLILTLAWSQAERVADAVDELAAQHGLFVYDPQGVEEDEGDPVEAQFDDTVQPCKHVAPFLKGLRILGKVRGRSYGDGILVEGVLGYDQLPRGLVANREARIVGCAECWCSVAEYDFYREGWP